jgi:hypothetical protein
MLRTGVVALLLIATLTSAGLTGDVSNGIVHYQVDAGQDGDAPDLCALADAAFAVQAEQTINGLLVPIDDERDVYTFNVNATLKGNKIDVFAFPAFLSRIDISLDVQVPGCGGSVLDPANHHGNVTTVPAPGPGEKTITPGPKEECAERWKFTINSVDPLRAPTAVHLMMSNGERIDVPFTHITPAGVAHYTSSVTNGYTLHSASANIYSSWSGHFHMNQQICGGTEGDYFTSYPSGSQYRTTFTPAFVGAYIIEVSYAGERPVPTTIPVTCHIGCRDVLQLGSEEGGYDLTPSAPGLW